jgi:hypothetical protein
MCIYDGSVASTETARPDPVPQNLRRFCYNF